MDSSGVIMKWYNRPIYNGRTLGGYAKARHEKKPSDAALDMAAVIADLDGMYDTVKPASAYPYHVAAAFGFGWDDLDTYVSPAFIAAAKQGSNSNRSVRVSNETDFFEAVSKNIRSCPLNA